MIVKPNGHFIKAKVFQELKIRLKTFCYCFLKSFGIPHVFQLDSNLISLATLLLHKNQALIH
ncbi:hypothetical protein AAULH_11781 [Lactobacillus helveticus MTCC 5463]|nr:hypothetical protein AAULH_11781 [Lactobacillus helveticus MTCC 5463]